MAAAGGKKKKGVEVATLIWRQSSLLGEAEVRARNIFVHARSIVVHARAHMLTRTLACRCVGTSRC